MNFQRNIQIVFGCVFLKKSKSIPKILYECSVCDDAKYQTNFLKTFFMTYSQISYLQCSLIMPMDTTVL